MSLLTVTHLQKIYTTRFGGAQVEALRDVNFTVEEGCLLSTSHLAHPRLSSTVRKPSLTSTPAKNAPRGTR